MRVRYKGDKVEVEVEGGSTKECFTELAVAIEVFGSSVCGACDSHRTVPTVRENAGNHYYAMKCLDCGSELSFGQRRQDGSLYPRKKNPKTNEWLEHSGWVKYQPKARAEVNADEFESF